MSEEPVGLARLEWAAFLEGFRQGADWGDPAGVMPVADDAAKRAWINLNGTMPIPDINP